MALEGSTTLISLLRIPQANCLYVLCLYNLSSGPSNDSLHCCLYWYQAACRNHLFIHTGLNPGCWVMHVGFSHSPLVTASLSLFVICAMSWQHMHASVLPLMWQLLQDHLTYRSETTTELFYIYHEVQVKKPDKHQQLRGDSR